jgi:hypothetical protein
MMWFFSKKKGEAVFRHEGSVLAVSSGTPQPMYRTLHFGLKPGHMVLVRGNEYVADDPGYMNFFRPESGSDGRLNTLRGQRLMGRGHMSVRVGVDIRVRVWTLFPLHIRVIRADYNLSSVSVRDWYLWRRTVDWLAGGISSRATWFTQSRTL